MLAMAPPSGPAAALPIRPTGPQPPDRLSGVASQAEPSIFLGLTCMRLIVSTTQFGAGSAVACPRRSNPWSTPQPQRHDVVRPSRHDIIVRGACGVLPEVGIVAEDGCVLPTCRVLRLSCSEGGGAGQSSEKSARTTTAIGTCVPGQV
jgi:hypothetical protein